MLQWKKKVGDSVAADEILIDIETDKVVLEVPAPAAGVLVELLVGDGGTVVLGGIFEDSDKNDEAKVPGLGDVPVLGWLFRNRQQLRKRSELLIFLTPRVLEDGMGAAQQVGPVAPGPDPRP